MDVEDFDDRFLKDYKKKDLSLNATKWIPSPVLLHRKCTESDIKKLEEKLKITLPDDYKSVLLEHQTHVPMHKVFACQDLQTDKWRTRTMGPLYHCIDDCHPNYADYHILAHPKNKEWCAKKIQIAIGETSDGSLICLSLTMGGVIVLNETGASLAGSSFTDFLWRMRLETKNILSEEQKSSEFFCDNCDKSILSSYSRYHCSTCDNSDNSFDLCSKCYSSKEYNHDTTHNIVCCESGDLFSKITPYREVVPKEPSSISTEEVNSKRRIGHPLVYCPWDENCYQEFPELLKRNRRENLLVRSEYYALNGHLKEDKMFVHDIMIDRHSVWYPGNGNDNFAYSIGIYYLHGLPEILLVSEDKSLDSRSLGLTINAINSCILLDGMKVNEGTSFSDLVKHCKDNSFTSNINYNNYSHCKFEKLSVEGIKGYLGYCIWFYVNYMDIIPPDFPVLVCKFNLKQ